MLETLGQALGAFGGLVLQARADRAGDGEQIRLDPPAQTPRASLQQPVQARDRTL